MLILTFVPKSLSFVATGVTRVVTGGYVGVKALTRALIHRREVLRLSELDERGLKDIGLVRSDIDGALTVSWLKDPSAALAARSSARAGVASVRREEGVRQALVKTAVAKPLAPRPAAAGSNSTVACSA
ncbi:hypothetical protein FG93_00309 [Bosea sp. LC85]|uniref:DUF1127 domain-containing protein n=1 Tax=Bosea sp. LC85 TaxID=1502851 RepID=UPI0004E44D38|nr:DUF1127 domain-containing protein [Bosea sp. LC85]KFC75290.1 hypothetical protein FG93_00309 [Bosea sp. LC85]